MKILSGKSVSVLALLMAGAGLLGTTVLAQTQGPFTAAQADAGRAAYATNCIACHQANLAGEGDAAAIAADHTEEQRGYEPAEGCPVELG